MRPTEMTKLLREQVLQRLQGEITELTGQRQQQHDPLATVFHETAARNFSRRPYPKRLLNALNVAGIPYRFVVTGAWDEQTKTYTADVSLRITGGAPERIPLQATPTQQATLTKARLDAEQLEDNLAARYKQQADLLSTGGYKRLTQLIKSLLVEGDTDLQELTNKLADRLIAAMST